MKKIVAILMVKNESRILRRCMEALINVVDAYCVHDTGSVDDTRDIALAFLKGKKGCVTQSEWKNFGTNRTISFQAARDYVRDVLEWDLSTTYGLLLDADMVFMPGKLLEQDLTEVGYSVIQCAGNIEYPNCRLVRMDYIWKCVGVTHEYWDGPVVRLAKEVCYIDDRNDGGCKSDKFERDVRLLRQGLVDEPSNVRYMFYLAQSYHSLGRWRDSIDMYKRRIAAGGWEEEIWYSHYMIAQCHLSLGDPFKFEAWMLRAYKYRPSRAEPLYKLAKYFREHAQHYKAYYYAKEGSKIPLSNDSLFVETEVYTSLFEYEQSILDYYVHTDKTMGLRSSVRYMLNGSSHLQNVLANLRFYVKPLGTIRPLALPTPFGDAYTPSAISIHTYPYANVRYVNYRVTPTGEYQTPSNQPVQTENAYVNLATGEVFSKMDDASVTLPRRDVRVRGLEDIRLCGDTFTATVQEYAEGVRVLEGKYDGIEGCYSHCKVLPSPTNRPCEKNWLAIPSTDSYIYDWHPFQIIGGLSKTYKTPPIFSLFRGSAPPIQVGSDWWVLVHMVEHSKPRAYTHCFVSLNSQFQPIAVSLPFVFRSSSIEYCISTRLVESSIECYVSFMDKDPAVVTIRQDELEWVSVKVV